jgi:hypothetical protein
MAHVFLSSRRISLALSIACAMVVHAAPAHAATQTTTGIPGRLAAMAAPVARGMMPPPARTRPTPPTPPSQRGVRVETAAMESPSIPAPPDHPAPAAKAETAAMPTLPPLPM